MENLEHSTPVIKSSWLRVLLFFIAFNVVYFAFQFIGIWLISIVTHQTFTQALQLFSSQINSGGVEINNLLILQFTIFLGTMAIVWLFRHFLDRKSISSLGFKLKKFKRDAAYGFILGIILISFGFFGLYLNGNIVIHQIHFAAGSLILSFIFFIIVALNEEIVIRGYILSNLLESYHPFTALGVSAFLFSIMHGLNPNLSIIGLINIFLAGVLFGLYYIYKRNLWFPIMLHLSWNFFQGPIYGFEVSGIDSKSLISQKIEGASIITGGNFGFEGSVLLTFIMVIVIYLMYRHYHQAIPRSQTDV